MKDKPENTPVTNRLDNSNAVEFELYNGKALRIGVIGNPPEVREGQVEFEEITFDGLIKWKKNPYDAIFVMPENLTEASESQYSNLYLRSTVPYFFISARSLIPFTSSENIEYSDTWHWEPGFTYTNGVYNQTNEEKLNRLGFGLYNDEKTDAHINAMYSLVFKKIEELDL